MLTLSCASQEKSMTVDGSRTGPGSVCFHFTIKIYNPLSLLSPTPTTVFWLGGLGGGCLPERVYISLKQQQGKYEGTKINKSAKTGQMFIVVAGTRNDGWLLPEMSRNRRQLLHSNQMQKDPDRERETKWLDDYMCESRRCRTNFHVL